MIIADLLSSVDNEFLGFSDFLAVAATDASTVKVDAAAQWEATTSSEIPWNCIETVGVAAGLRMCPQQTTCEVEHFKRELTIAARTVVGEQEGGLCFSGIDAGREVKQMHGQLRIYDEVQLHMVFVVLRVPSPEQQGMSTR